MSRTPAVDEEPSADHSITLLIGRLSRDPERRQLPSGTVVLALEVSTRPRQGSVESVPVAWMDPPARLSLSAGDRVVVLGRTKRRFFRATGMTQSRTEVVADRVVPVRQASRAATLLEVAIERVVEAGSLVDGSGS